MCVSLNSYSGGSPLTKQLVRNWKLLFFGDFEVVTFIIIAASNETSQYNTSKIQKRLYISVSVDISSGN